jgi:hypothetical protein
MSLPTGIASAEQHAESPRMYLASIIARGLVKVPSHFVIRINRPTNKPVGWRGGAAITAGPFLTCAPVHIRKADQPTIFSGSRSCSFAIYFFRSSPSPFFSKLRAAGRLSRHQERGLAHDVVGADQEADAVFYEISTFDE